MSTGPWNRAGHFASFWQHFDAAEKWQRRHVEMVRESYALAPETAIQKGPVGSSLLKPIEGTLGRKQDDHFKDVVEAYVEAEVEADPEYVEFKRITVEHRKKQAEKREEEQKSSKGDHWITVNNEDFILADQIGVHGVTKRSLDEPDEKTKVLKKRKAAQDMYGQSAEKLLAMETALDVQFNELMKSRQPALWPNIPLRF